MINLLKHIKDKDEEKDFVSDKEEEDKKESSLNEINKQIQQNKQITNLLSISS